MSIKEFDLDNDIELDKKALDTHKIDANAHKELFDKVNSTYIKSLSVSGRTITYTKGDGTTGTITTQDTDTTYSKLSQFTNDSGYITSAGSCAHATSADTATNANMLTGFVSSGNQIGWGVQTGTAVQVMNDSTGGSVGYRRDCPSNGKVSMVIDGYIYQNEGQYQVIDTNTIGSQTAGYAYRSANNGSFFINGYEVSVG